MMRLASWPVLLSVLVLAAGSPTLFSLGFSPAMICVADVTAVGFIAVVAHLIGSWRVGHAI